MDVATNRSVPYNLCCW